MRLDGSSTKFPNEHFELLSAEISTTQTAGMINYPMAHVLSAKLTVKYIIYAQQYAVLYSTFSWKTLDRYIINRCLVLNVIEC